MRFLRRLISYILLYVVDVLVKLFTGHIEPTNRLLLIRLDAIGDFVVWLDSARAFRSLYPNSKITLCVNSASFELAKVLPFWDEVVEVDLKRFNASFIYRYRLVLQIRQSAFGTVIQPTFSRVFLHGDALVRASGAKFRIGSVGDRTNIGSFLKRISDAWYTKLVPAASGPMMELERNAEFISNLSEQVVNASLPVLPNMGELPFRLALNASYFVVFPGASWTGRQWPTSKFAETVATIYRRTGWIPVLCGGPGDKVVCQDVIDQSGVVCAINFCGLTTLTELTEVLRAAKLLISNETSAVHIAVAVFTPTVCILGGGHFGRFMPYPAGLDRGLSAIAVHKMPCYNCNWHCTQPHSASDPVPCITNVTVGNVLGQVEMVLANANNHEIELCKKQKA